SIARCNDVNPRQPRAGTGHRLTRRSVMRGVSVQASTPDEVVAAVLRRLNQRQIEGATASFAKDVRFTNHGSEHAIAHWRLPVTMTEALYAGLSRRILISLAGVSIVRVPDGKIADWADYYDGLTSRRTSLAAHFTDWIGY